MRLSATLIGGVAWLAVERQFGLILRARAPSIGGVLTTIEFLSDFTIISNILVALVRTTVSIGRADENLARPRVLGAAALYIGVTGCIYLFVPSGMGAPRGTQWLADVLLHNAVPMHYLGW